MGLRPDDFIIGRDTGQSEFPGHIRTLAKFGKLRDFLLVLDGDSRDRENEIKRTADEYGQAVQPLFLPGNSPPETWIWRILEQQRDDYTSLLGMAAPDIETRMRNIIQMVSGSVHQQDTDKLAAAAFADELGRTVPDIARIVGQREARRTHGEAATFLVQLKEQITAWRQT